MVRGNYFAKFAVHTLNCFCDNASLIRRDKSVHKYHLSGAFFGASYKALKKLGQDKGYSLLGSNSSGNNLFFIRNDLSHNFINLIQNAEYLESTFCDFKDSNGEHLYISREERLNLLSNCDIYDIPQGKVVKLKSLL